MTRFLLIILAISFQDVSARTTGCDFPVPSYKIGEFATSGVRRTTYDRAMDRIEAVYGPIFEAANCPLVLVRSWSDGTVNAQAWKENGQCYVEMFGGLARYPGMTETALELVACHEIGHHLGGRPYYSGSYMSVEGQSDYFATLDCMYQINTPSRAASLVLAKTLAKLNGEQIPSRATRATEQVRYTLEGHPRAQCRLDQFDNGRLNQGRAMCWYAGH
jgi:hypothetical protein